MKISSRGFVCGKDKSRNPRLGNLIDATRFTRRKVADETLSAEKFVWRIALWVLLLRKPLLKPLMAFVEEEDGKLYAIDSESPNMD